MGSVVVIEETDSSRGPARPGLGQAVSPHPPHNDGHLPAWPWPGDVVCSLGRRRRGGPVAAAHVSCRLEQVFQTRERPGLSRHVSPGLQARLTLA